MKLLIQKNSKAYESLISLCCICLSRAYSDHSQRGSEWPLHRVSRVPLLSAAIWSWGLQREQVLAFSRQVHRMGQCYSVIEEHISFPEVSANSIRVELLPAAFLLLEPRMHTPTERGEIPGTGVD